MEELECARLLEHASLCAHGMLTLWMGAAEWSFQTFWKVPLGPTLAVAFLTPRTSNTEPSVRKSRILCFSGEACDNVQCMYTEGTLGQKWLLGSPRGKTGFVMIIFLIYFIKLVESEHYMKCR